MASKRDNWKECKICFEAYSDPHVLQCGHTFCKKCIDGLESTTCPLCNVPSTSVIKNFAMVDLLEEIERMKTMKPKTQQIDKVTPLSDIAQRPWSLTNSVKLKNLTYNLRIIDGDIWTCQRGRSVVYKLDLSELKEIIFSFPVTLFHRACYGVNANAILDDSAVYDIAKEGKNKLVASENGLWCALDDGSYRQRLGEKEHIGIYVTDRLFYYVTNDNIIMNSVVCGKTEIYSRKSPRPAQHTDRYSGRIMTAAPGDNFIIVCDSSKNTVESFLVECGVDEYLKESIKVAGKNVYLTGLRYCRKPFTGNKDNITLDSPYICFSDKRGNALIADCGNDRLLLRSFNNEYKEINLQPPVIAPHCAAYYDGKLFVASWHHQKLYRYEYTSEEIDK